MVTIKIKFSHIFLIAVTALNKLFKNMKIEKFTSCIFSAAIQHSQFVTQFNNVITTLQWGNERLNGVLYDGSWTFWGGDWGGEQ